MGVRMVLTVEIEVFDEQEVDLDLPGLMYHMEAALGSKWYTILVKEDDDDLYYVDRAQDGTHNAFAFPVERE